MMEKKYKFIILGLLVFIVGIILLNFELKDYRKENIFPIDIKENAVEISIKFDDTKDYRFIRGKYNQNIIIKKIEDSSYDDEILVRAKYLDTSKLNYNINYSSDYTDVIFSNTLNLNIDNIHYATDLLLKCIEDKTIYNYNSIKYSRIEIYASESILEKIKVMNYEDLDR